MAGPCQHCRWWAGVWLKVSSQLPALLGTVGGLWEGQCQPEKPQRKKTALPLPWRSTQAGQGTRRDEGLKCQVDRDWIVPGSRSAGEQPDDSRVQALELGLEAGGTWWSQKAGWWGREHSARSQGTHSLLPQAVLFARFRTGGHADEWEL